MATREQATLKRVLRAVESMAATVAEIRDHLKAPALEPTQREQAIRARERKALSACFRRGWRRRELERCYIPGVRQGPGRPKYVALLEHLSKGRPITAARRAEDDVLTDPAEMRQCERDVTWEGAEAGQDLRSEED
jgi:hypothetical protein